MLRGLPEAYYKLEGLTTPTDSRLPTPPLAYLVLRESAAWPPGRYAVGHESGLAIQ